MRTLTVPQRLYHDGEGIRGSRSVSGTFVAHHVSEEARRRLLELAGEPVPCSALERLVERVTDEGGSGFVQLSRSVCEDSKYTLLVIPPGERYASIRLRGDHIEELAAVALSMYGKRRDSEEAPRIMERFALGDCKGERCIHVNVKTPCDEDGCSGVVAVSGEFHPGPDGKVLLVSVPCSACAATYSLKFEPTDTEPMSL